MEYKLPELCSEEKCTACTACMNICSQQAISMQENEKGELHPKVDVDKCIGCGVCEKICPELNCKLERHSLPTVYSCWLRDSECRKQSTSGGVAYAISCAVIEQGGHVWGAAYIDDMQPVYVEANTLDELRPIQKSKYVQCALQDCFKKIQEELKAGDLVLFTGTPCHCKGLLSFLRKKYDNLITLDLVCHGTPGQGVFRKYKEYLESCYNDKLDFFSFRPKRVSNGQEMGYCTLAHFKRKGEVEIVKQENGYLVGFYRNIILRECCYKCQANGLQRYADITVADFWGLGRIKPFPHWKQHNLGISMLALNSEKAKKFFNIFKSKLEYEERPLEEAYCSNHPYNHASVKSSKTDIFWKEWNSKSWNELTEKYFQLNGKEKMFWYIKRYISPNFLFYIKYLLKWVK